MNQDGPDIVVMKEDGSCTGAVGNRKGLVGEFGPQVLSQLSLYRPLLFGDDRCFGFREIGSAVVPYGLLTGASVCLGPYGKDGAERSPFGLWDRGRGRLFLGGFVVGGSRLLNTGVEIPRIEPVDADSDHVPVRPVFDACAIPMGGGRSLRELAVQVGRVVAVSA